MQDFNFSNIWVMSSLPLHLSFINKHYTEARPESKCKIFQRFKDHDKKCHLKSNKYSDQFCKQWMKFTHYISFVISNHQDILTSPEKSVSNKGPLLKYLQ